MTIERALPQNKSDALWKASFVLMISWTLLDRSPPTGIMLTPTAAAKAAVHRYAYQAYPQWSVDHMSLACPAIIAELNGYLNNDSRIDPWGRPYIVRCTAPSQFARAAFVALSSGPDRKVGTSDDIQDHF